MNAQQRSLLKLALHDVLVDAGGALDALGAFRQIKIKMNDDRAPMLMCLEAGCRPDDMLMLERPDGVIRTQALGEGKAQPLELVDDAKSANLALLGGGTGSEHVAAALQHQLTLQERCERQPKSEWDYLRRFEHTPLYAMDGNRDSHE